MMVKFFSISTVIIVGIVTAIQVQLSTSVDAVLSKNGGEAYSHESSQGVAKQKLTPTVSVTPKSMLEANSEASTTLQERIASLMQAALLAKSNQEFTKSIDLYNQIIALLEKSYAPEELKLYAEVHFLKASILEFNIGDKEAAIKTYENLIEKLDGFNTLDLIQLSTKAQLYEASMLEHERSLSVYDAIIERFKNSDNPALLKNYAAAQFAKSYTLKNGEAIAIYNELIQKLSNYDNNELRQQLYQAQTNKAYILEHALENKKAAIKVYDEIIEQFSQYDDPEYSEKVESALFSKSFLLMDEHQETEAMEIFDGIIDNYQENGDGENNKNFEYAIVNNIELALILGNDDNRYQELAHTYLSTSAEAQPQIEMLEILKNAQEINQDEALETWKNQYQDFYFQNWSFDQLETWNNAMEESETQARVKKYLNVFENHNNYVIYQDPYQENQNQE